MPKHRCDIIERNAYFKKSKALNTKGKSITFVLLPKMFRRRWHCVKIKRISIEFKVLISYLYRIQLSFLPNCKIQSKMRCRFGIVNLCEYRESAVIQ